MTLTQLEYVVAVATYRSFVAAAEKCFVTQPTLSMQIQKLEDELGVKLFDRNKHPISATEIGEAIISQAKTILSEAGKVTEIISKSKDQVWGTFKLAIIPTVAPYILPSFLVKYAAKYPKVKLTVVEMTTPEIIKALENDELDAAILSTPLERPLIQEHPLFFEPLVAYFTNEDAKGLPNVVKPTDINLEKLWLLHEGNCLRNQVLNLCEENIQNIQADKPYFYESGSVDMLRKMVDTNGGVAILPELATFEFQEKYMDNIRYFENPQPEREISIVTNSHFVRNSILESLKEEILAIIPEKMKIQKENRNILKIQTPKF